MNRKKSSLKINGSGDEFTYCSAVLSMVLKNLNVNDHQINDLIPKLLFALKNEDELNFSSEFSKLDQTLDQYQINAIHGLFYGILVEQVIQSAMESASERRLFLLNQLKSHHSENKSREEYYGLGGKKPRRFMLQMLNKGTSFFSKSSPNIRRFSSKTNEAMNGSHLFPNEQKQCIIGNILCHQECSHIHSSCNKITQWINDISASKINGEGVLDFSELISSIESNTSESSKYRRKLDVLKILAPHCKEGEKCTTTFDNQNVILNYEKNVQPTKVQAGRWIKGAQIGTGSFGQVHIGLNEDTGDLIAAKIIYLTYPETSTNIVDSLYYEIELMRKLQHPNIVSYLGAELNEENCSIVIFQEWIPGSISSLLSNFGPFNERRIAQVTYQILQGLIYLHSKCIIHRDIKGSNVLIDNRGIVKLCDFGASKLVALESVMSPDNHTHIGTPFFMAPEVLFGEQYGAQVDIWSLGGAVLEMLTGKPPYNTINLRTPVALRDWLKKNDGPPPIPDQVSHLLRQFLEQCFIRQPSKRPAAQNLILDPFLCIRTVPIKRNEEGVKTCVHNLETMEPSYAKSTMEKLSTALHDTKVNMTSKKILSPEYSPQPNHLHKIEHNNSLGRVNFVDRSQNVEIENNTDLRNHVDGKCQEKSLTSKPQTNPYARRRRKDSFKYSDKCIEASISSKNSPHLSPRKRENDESQNIKQKKITQKNNVQIGTTSILSPSTPPQRTVRKDLSTSE